MREDSWNAYLLYLPISILLFIIRILPINAVLNFGVFMGTVVYHIHVKRRRTANANLKAAYGKKLSQEKRKKIILKMFRNFGLNIVELFLMPGMSDKYFGKYTKVRNIDRVEKALAKKKGIVFLSAHYGNWEYITSYISLKYALHSFFNKNFIKGKVFLFFLKKSVLSFPPTNILSSSSKRSVIWGFFFNWRLVLVIL